MLEVMLRNFIAAEHSRYGLSYVESCGVSSAECHVHLVGVNRLSACRKFFWMHSWQNGTRCRDGVNVLWCRSHLVWLVFEGSIPTCACFLLENFL